MHVPTAPAQALTGIPSSRFALHSQASAFSIIGPTAPSHSMLTAELHLRPITSAGSPGNAAFVKFTSHSSAFDAAIFS